MDHQTTDQSQLHEITHIAVTNPSASRQELLSEDVDSSEVTPRDNRHHFWQRRRQRQEATFSDNKPAQHPQPSETDDPLFTSAQFTVAAPFEELSNFQASMHLLKGSVGTGVLAMPSAIRDSGLLFGTLSLVIVSFIITHSMHLLLESAQYLRHLHSVRRAAAKERARTVTVTSGVVFTFTTESPDDTEMQASSRATNDTSEGFMLPPDEIRLDYYETVRMTFLKATPAFRGWAWLAGVLNVCLIVAQLGFLSVYQIFVADNTKRIVDYYKLPYAPPLWVYFLVLFALIVPLVFVKTLDKLAFLSSMANALGIGGLFLVIIYCIQDLRPVTEQPLIRSMHTLPLAFGVIVFAFESINIILPIENQMRQKRDMMGWFGVLSVNMCLVTALYIAVGFFGYLRFGQEVEGAITYSVPMEPWYFAISKPMYTISIFISYTLQFYVAFSVLWELILPHLRHTSTRALLWTDAILRLGIVTFALIVSMTVPFIDLLISFMGAFAGAAIVLVFPPLVHSINTWMQLGNTRRCWLIITKNIFMILFGVVGAFVGGAVSLNEIVVKVAEKF